MATAGRLGRPAEQSPQVLWVTWHESAQGGHLLVCHLVVEVLVVGDADAGLELHSRRAHRRGARGRCSGASAGLRHRAACRPSPNAALLEPAPIITRVRSLRVAKLDSIGSVDLTCRRCSRAVVEPSARLSPRRASRRPCVLGVEVSRKRSTRAGVRTRRGSIISGGRVFARGIGALAVHARRSDPHGPRADRDAPRALAHCARPGPCQARRPRRRTRAGARGPQPPAPRRS